MENEFNPKYLTEAKKFYDEALKELARGRQDGSDTIIRDAAEKGWNAVVEATNHLFEKCRLPVPKNHHDRRKGLIELARGNRIIEEKGFRERYMAREQGLHEYCFYEGIYDLALLEKDLYKVGDYIKDIEELEV